MIEKIGIWGCGLTGYSLAVALAEQGVNCMLTDIDACRVQAVQVGQIPFDTVSPESVGKLGDEGRKLLAATSNWEDLLVDRQVQILCMSTESNGHVSSAALEDVVWKIASSRSALRPLYLIIESTIAPTWLDRIVRPAFQRSGWDLDREVHLGCSPRRDWFIDSTHTLASVPKVLGADSEACLAVMERLYKRVSKEILVAQDERHAAATKLVENFYRYNAVLLANRLAGAMPDFDVAELLRLASSKWNQELYHPSLGIGGYCLPLAKDYLIETLARPDHLPLEELGSQEQREARSLFRRLFPGEGEGREVVILGLSYAPGLRIHTRSPTLRLVGHLKRMRWEVTVHDPLYSDEEIQVLSGAPPAQLPEDLATAHTVVVMTEHPTSQREIPFDEISAALRPGTRVIDNLGAWRGRYLGPGVLYLEVGAILPEVGEFETDAQAIAVPGIGSSATARRLRAWFEARDEAGERASIFAAAASIAAIDRPYIRVNFAGGRASMSEVSERLATLAERPLGEWSDGEVEGVGALALLGMARTRLEYVDMELSMPLLEAHLEETRERYSRALGEVGEEGVAPEAGLPWWELASRLTTIRPRINRHYLRIAQIDGATWHRRELLLRRDALTRAEGNGQQKLPSLLHSRLAPFGEPREDEGPEALLRRLTIAALPDRDGAHRLLQTVMQTAVEDPEVAADHATLLAPRGTRLDKPWEMGREDFLAWVVFRDRFESRGALADLPTIRRAMYAHHSLKKKKMARKYLAKYGPGSRASLEDDLGDLGIYFNESAHHRGHQICGIQAAMRVLMPLELWRNGDLVRVEGLTDFRVTRVEPGETSHFEIGQFPTFFRYGTLVRTILETLYSHNQTLPSVIEV